MSWHGIYQDENKLSKKSGAHQYKARYLIKTAHLGAAT